MQNILNLLSDLSSKKYFQMEKQVNVLKYHKGREVRVEPGGGQADGTAHLWQSQPLRCITTDALPKTSLELEII